MSAWFSRLKREYEAGNLPAKQYLVLCELGRFDACRLGIFPSHRTLAARARCGVRTVQRALQAARRLETRVRAAWRSLQGPNRYVLKVAQAANLAEKIPTTKKNRLGNGRAARSGPCWKPRAGCRTC